MKRESALCQFPFHWKTLTSPSGWLVDVQIKRSCCGSSALETVASLPAGEGHTELLCAGMELDRRGERESVECSLLRRALGSEREEEAKEEAGDYLFGKCEKISPIFVGLVRDKLCSSCSNNTASTGSTGLPNGGQSVAPVG